MIERVKRQLVVEKHDSNRQKTLVVIERVKGLLRVSSDRAMVPNDMEISHEFVTLKPNGTIY